MDTSADVIKQIESAYKTFSKGQRCIADYICNNYDQAVSMTAANLGRTVGVSESTVVRFASQLGYRGYPELQKALHELVKNRLNSMQRITLTSNRIGEEKLLTSVLHNDMNNLKMSMDNLDEATFEQAVHIIGGARKIYVVGGRSCSALASFMSFYLNYIFENVRCISSDSITESFEEICRMNEQDVVIGISFPRYSKKTVQTMAFARKRNAKIVTITDGKHSPLAEYADCAIFARSDMVSFVDSLVAPLSVINALLAALSIEYKDSVMSTMASMETIWDELNEYGRTNS